MPIPLYASTSFWNTPIGSLPAIDPNSAAMVQYALVGVSAKGWANTNAWGKPFYVGSSSDKLYHVTWSSYGISGAFDIRIPAGAKPSTGSDGHMVVFNGDDEFDFWIAVHDTTADTWSAAFVGKTSRSGWGALCGLGQHCNASVAAGFAQAGGLTRPDELAQGVIQHALSFSTPHTRSGIIACPATHTDGREATTSAIPEGARIQLDPSFVIPTIWAPWQRMIARALQVYGAYLGDTGGSLAISGEAADLDLRAGTWASVGALTGASLGFLPWAQFRVLEITAC